MKNRKIYSLMAAVLVALLNGTAYAQMKTTNEMMEKVYYKTIAVNGVEIFYIEAGDTTKPCLLLLHGFPSSSFMFRRLIDGLKDQYHLIAPTYPGFGLSAMPAPSDFDYSFEHLAALMTQFVDLLGIKKATFVMHDYGGPVGFRMLMHRPELLECMIVMNANAYREGLTESSQPLFDLWENNTEENRDRVAQLLTTEGTTFQYYDGVTDPAVIDPSVIYTDQFFLDRKGNTDIQLTLLYDYRKNVEQYPAWQRLLKEIQPPTLVVWGENDKFFSKEGAKKYSADIADIEYSFYPTGHFPLEEFHNAIEQRITDFLVRKLEK